MLYHYGCILSRTATKALSCLPFGSDVLSRTFAHLSFEERRTISRMRDQKFSQSEIARCLGRDRGTISREIRRNYWHDCEFPDADGYWAMTANDMAHDRRWRIGNPGDLDRPFPRSGDHRLQYRRWRKLRAPRYSVSASGRMEPGSCVEDAGTPPSRTRILTLSVFSYLFVFSYFC